MANNSRFATAGNALFRPSAFHLILKKVDVAQRSELYTYYNIETKTCVSVKGSLVNMECIVSLSYTNSKYLLKCRLIDANVDSGDTAAAMH